VAEVEIPRAGGLERQGRRTAPFHPRPAEQDQAEQHRLRPAERRPQDRVAGRKHSF
jgi:hypothetical protein